MRYLPSKLFCASILAFTLTFAINAHAQSGAGPVVNQPSQAPSTTTNMVSEQTDAASDKNDVPAKSTSDFFNNLKNCDQLTNKRITFQTNKVIMIRISASDSAFCHVETLRFENQNVKQKASCDISKEDIDDITSPKSLAIVQQFELTKSNNQQVLDIFSKLLACFSTNTETLPTTPTQSPSMTPSVQQSTPDTTTYDYGKQLQ